VLDDRYDRREQDRVDRSRTVRRAVDVDRVDAHDGRTAGDQSLGRRVGEVGMRRVPVVVGAPESVPAGAEQLRPGMKADLKNRERDEIKNREAADE